MSNTNPLQLLRSSTANKRPLAAGLVDGRPAINTNSASPGLFFKDSTGGLVKVGPVHVGTTAPNASPASGGATGNSVGEQWLDTTGGTYVLKIWDGSAWRSESGTFVDVNGDVMTGALVMDNQQQVRFRETTANGTNYIALQAPASVASDKTITLPDVDGTVVTTGDTGTVTSTMILNGTIVDADVNASAAIAGTKISPDFGSRTVQTTGVFSAALGTAGVPTFTFTGDLNTGIYSPGADQVAISTGGTGRLFVDASGNVGITESSPSSYSAGAGIPTLVLKGSSATFPARSGAIALLSQDTTTAKTFIYHDTDFNIQNTTATNIRFLTNNAERLRITSAGLVGVGTSVPGYLFEASRNTAGDVAAFTGSTDRLRPLVFSSSDNTASGAVWTRKIDSAFGIHAWSTNSVERMRLTSTGLGIGTSSPTQRLQITDGSLSNFYIAPGYNSGQGTLLATGGSEYLAFATNGLANERLRITSAGLVGIGTSAVSDACVLTLQESAATGTAIALRNRNSTQTWRVAVDATAVDDKMLALIDGTTSTVRVALTDTGRVGIGTTSPGGKLVISDGTTTFQFDPVGGTGNILRSLTSGGSRDSLLFDASQYVYSNGATEYARIDSSGRLGIGTSSPGTLVEGRITGGGGTPATSGTSQPNAVFRVSGSGTTGVLDIGCNSGAPWIQSTDRTDLSQKYSLLLNPNGGSVGIGTASPDVALHVATGNATGYIKIDGGTSSSATNGVQFRSSSNTYSAEVSHYQSNLSLYTANNERARIDSSGRLLVGTSSSTGNIREGQLFSVTAQNSGYGGMSLSCYNSGSVAPIFDFNTSASSSSGNYAAVASGRLLGTIVFRGADGTQLLEGAAISAVVDGGVSTNDLPTRLVFSTTADGASSPTERWRYSNNGETQIRNMAEVFPVTDNACLLGKNGNRWSAVWAANGTIQTSDKRTKTEVLDATLGADFVKSLRPVSYKWIEGGKKPTGEFDEDNNYIYESVPGTRTHWGFIAQEVKQAVDAAGVDFGGWVLTDKDDPDSQQALRYDQFIAPLTKALQEALEKIETLEAAVTALQQP